jgi:hypothetical protein
MGMTLTFYAAAVEEFLAIWLNEDEVAFAEGINTLSQADFSLHLRFPDDLNALWGCLHDHGIGVAATFEDNAQLVWSDEMSESLFIVHPQGLRLSTWWTFVRRIALN